MGSGTTLPKSEQLFFDRLRLLLTIQSLEIHENVLAGLPPAIRTKIDMACSDHNFLQGK